MVIPAMAFMSVLEIVLWFFLPAIVAMLLYWTAHMLVAKHASESTMDAAKWASVRVGAIHALILALAFSGLRAEHNELQEGIDNEALAIEQLYRGLESFGTPQAQKIQANLANYTRLVIEEEWPSMVAGAPLEKADLLVDTIYRQIIELSGNTNNSGLASTLLNDINDIENARGQRSFDIDEPISVVFWLIAIVGLILTCVSFFPTPYSSFRSLFLGMFAGINGLIFFAISEFSHPFSGVFPTEPTPFVEVLERTIEAGG
ncbi:hypothetical protein [Ruegeria sp. SCP11]|uniref:bestrophin-like domain n=1 Tax=Ruegeria sp. SCP11 TaxID=3141378 RepID=UPI003337A8A1